MTQQSTDVGASFPTRSGPHRSLDSRDTIEKGAPPSRPGLESGGMRTPWRLSAGIVILMALQAGAGLAFPQMYRDADWVKLTWLGNDAVTLLVAVPVSIGALLVARRGSLRAELVWAAMLAYTMYNYAFYLLGAVLTVLFPLYALLISGSLICFVALLGRLDVATLPERFAEQAPVRWIAGYLVFMGSGLAVAWLAQWAGHVFLGKEPSVGEPAFRLIASLDLTLVVPYFLLGGVLLWQRRPWGYALGAVMTIKGALYTGLLTVNAALAAGAGTAGAAAEIPIWGIWSLASLAVAWALLRQVVVEPGD